MSEQLIYTYSHSVHGNVFVRLGKAIVGGYGVVGKSRGVGVALEEEMVALARRGMVPKDGNPGTQYFYRTGFCAGKSQHIFGCTHRVEKGKNAGKYICHIFALSGEDVQTLWHRGCTLTPAGILLVLSMSDFWVKEWTGPAHWLERNAEPVWETIERDLQANLQPAWQYYTGRRETVNLMQEPRFQEACMLAFPDGTPTQDMLRVLHEAHSLRSDLGWTIPVFTYGGEEVTSMKNVMLLGIIGSGMQERAKMMGMPVLEVTEKLAERVKGGDAAMPPVPPPPPRRRITADVTHTEPKTKKREVGIRYTELLRKVGKCAVGVTVILVLLWGGYYAWKNFDVVQEKIEKTVETTKKGKEEREQEKKETSKEVTRSLSSEEERLLMGYIAPVKVGSRLPSPLKSALQGTLPVRLKDGNVAIYPLGDDTEQEAVSYELSPEGTIAEISADGQPGSWRLVVTDEGEARGGVITLRVENGVLRGVTNEKGQPVAVLLPVPVDGDRTGTVLLLPEWELKVSGEVTLDKKFVENFNLQLTPDCFETTPQKTRFIRDEAMKALEGAQGMVKCTFGNIVLPNAAANHAFSVIPNEVGDVDGLQLAQEPMQGEESYIRCRLQGECPFDFTMALVKAVVKDANKLHGPASGKKRPASSVGGLYYAVSEIIKTSGKKRTAAITNYVTMFSNEEFVDFCSSELSHMPMPHESVFDKGEDKQPRGRGQSPFHRLRERVAYQPQIDPKEMRRFESFDYLGVRRFLCEWMENIAKREFLAQAEKYGRELKVPVRLRLRRVEAPDPGRLKWVFECEEAD